MANCNILDISCNISNFQNWLYSLIAPYLDPILNLINSLLQLIFNIWGLIWGLITACFNIGVAIGISIIGFLRDVFASDPTATAIIILIGLYCNIIIFIRVWNIIASLEIVGNKLPKIPM